MKYVRYLLATAFCLFWHHPLFAQVDKVPARTPDNLIVASYNIKWFGQTEHNNAKLAEVIKHFDICGILEVKDEDEVAKLVQVLNSTSRPEEKWGYAFGVRTHRPHGSYHEAYAVVWRKDRVELGNGVVGGVWDAEEAFRNDPYLVSFKRNNFDFTMMLVHTRWSNDADGTRANEVAMVAEQIVWLQGFLSERDYIVMGDFNYSATAKAMQDMATTAELVRVDPNDKSTFKSNFSAYASPYDHIFLTEGVMNEYIAHSAQVLDTTKLLYGANSIANMKLSNKELSDHLPVFAVFKTSGADDD